jgi:chorismate synthase
VNNDAFVVSDGKIAKASNHAGGTLGGISDGSPITFRVAVKPTPSISQSQQTVNQSGEEISVSIRGRHDPIIVPRAIVVVECMAAITVLDLLLTNMGAKLDNIKKIYE